MSTELAQRLGHASPAYEAARRLSDADKLREAQEAVDTLIHHLGCLRDETSNRANRELVELLNAAKAFKHDCVDGLLLAIMDLEVGNDD